MEELTITKELELENVKTAYFLEDNISKLRQEEQQLREDKPQKPIKPWKPVLKSATAMKVPYPRINPDIKFPQTWKRGACICGIGLLLCLFSPSLLIAPIIMVGGAYYTIFLFLTGFKKKKQLKEQKIEEIKNSFEYKSQCQQIDEKNHLQQIELDKKMQEEYSQQCEVYTEKLQKYNEELHLYETEDLPQWSETMEALQTAINETQSVLQNVYNKNIIPNQYRTLPSLLYLSAFLGTSQYDLKYAIERYDNYVLQCAQREQINIANAQLAVMREVRENQQYSIWLNEQMIELSEQGNNILKSIDRWQKADIATREYRRIKARREAKKRKK